MESRDLEPFHLGVVDVVTHAVQAALASVRATRRFVTQIVDEGSQKDRELKTALDPKNAGFGLGVWKFFRHPLI